MEQDAEQKVKIRFKFRSGEEFEAEGTPDFIERQRAQFLQLIGKPQDMPPRKGKHSHPSMLLFQPPLTEPSDSAPATNAAGGSSVVFPTDTVAEEPAFLRRSREERSTPYISPPGAAVSVSADTRLWEEIVKMEGKLVILRRKNRLLTAETAALVLIAAAKTLLGAQNGYAALHLSKALAKSGYGGERLDRILAGEIRLGTIKSFGSKRSRVYTLSNEGFAKAFVLAEKLVGEGHQL